MAVHEAEVPAGAALLSQIRHDLKTPLNQIIGYGEMLLEDAQAAESSEAAGLLEQLVKGAKSCVDAQARALQVSVEQVSEATWTSLCPDQIERAKHLADLLTQLRLNPSMRESISDLDRLARAISDLQTLAKGASRRWHNGDAAITAPESAQPVDDNPDVIPKPHLIKPVFSSDGEEPVLARNSLSALGRLLVVDDNEANREMLSRRLVREGYSVTLAGDGREALRKLEQESFDLMLLDIMMPELDGFAVLKMVRANPAWQNTAVIMISALDEISSVVRCIEMGAEDYLPKPFDPVLLRARIGAILDRKRLRDEERSRAVQMAAALAEAERQKQAAEAMLRNILPAKVADELREFGTVEPMYFEDVTIGFTDFVGFTLSTERLAAEELVGLLHEYFTAFDKIMARYGLEKLKTIGDSYMFASGMPERHPSHPVDAVLAALEMVETVKNLARPDALVDWKVRVGLHTGPVIAGVVGIHKFAFDIWGDSVNFASRMESSGAPDRVNLSERTFSRVKDFIHCTPRGPIHTKDGREVDMFFAEAPHQKLMGDRSVSPPVPFARRYKIYFQKEPRDFPAFFLNC